MKYALFLGCIIPTGQYAYEMSTREVLPNLGVEILDLEESSCCGFPIRSISTMGWIYLSARNLALAEKLGIDLLPICNGCQLSLTEVKHYLEDEKLKEKINSQLAIEGLEYTGNVEVRHILELLYDIIGVEKIKKSVKKPLHGLKIAAHYGCHALRPSKIGRADDSETPHKLEELVEALGAKSERYPELLDCCGSGEAMVSGKTTLAIAGSKLKSIQEFGFDSMTLICPSCMEIFDLKQRVINRLQNKKKINLPIVYYTQLLGLSMKISADKLGLNLNLSPVDKLLDKIGVK